LAQRVAFFINKGIRFRLQLQFWTCWENEVAASESEDDPMIALAVYLNRKNLQGAAQMMSVFERDPQCQREDSMESKTRKTQSTAKKCG
jgi:hypothetical protein